MLGFATSRYTIIRGESAENEYGDVVDSLTPVHTGVLGSVIERTRSVFNPSDGRVAVVQQLIGRFTNGTDIQDGDRIRDEVTNTVYVVSSVYTPTNMFAKGDLMLDLTHT